MPGMAGGDAGHVPEAAGRQPQHGRMVGGGVGGQGHERRRGQVGHVGDHGHQLVVAFGRHGHHVGAERGDHGPEPGEGLRVGGAGRGQDPGGTLEQLAVGAVDAFLLGAGHRVAPDEAGMGHRRDDGGLHAGHIGDDAARGDRPDGLAGDGAGRCGDEGDLGVGIATDGVEGPELEGPGRPRLVLVEAGDVPAPLAQGQPERASDQPGSDHRGPAPGPGHGAGLLGEVIAQRLGPLEVDVVQLGRAPAWSSGA